MTENVIVRMIQNDIEQMRLLLKMEHEVIKEMKAEDKKREMEILKKNILYTKENFGLDAELEKILREIS